MILPVARVLLVEDEALIRELLCEDLTNLGLEVVQAHDGGSAIRLLEQIDRLDLLVTDVHMPGRLDGIDVARQVRARYPAVPVIFATGRPEAVRTFGALGPREVCLTKPFRPSHAIVVVRKLLETSHGLLLGG